MKSLNILAAAVVLLGAAGAPLPAGLEASIRRVLGIFLGRFHEYAIAWRRNSDARYTPDIAADRLALPALAYAVTYPMAIVGIIGTLLVLKQIFRVDPPREAAEFAAKNRRQVEPLERHTLVVTNPNLEGVLGAIPGRVESQVTISRVRHGEETRAATDATVIHLDDRLAVVGTRAGLDQFERVVGRCSDEDPSLREQHHLPTRDRDCS